MVTAGITKEKIRGRREKNPRMSALSYMKKVEKKNHPVITRKSEITI
jgi:hypothetical protein